MDRLITLTVGTTGDEDYASTFLDMSETARGLAPNHDYLSMSAQAYTAVEDDEPEPERLYYDDNTLNKVRKVLMEHGLSSHLTTSAIGDMQNAGILFRERPPIKGR